VYNTGYYSAAAVVRLHFIHTTSFVESAAGIPISEEDLLELEVSLRNNPRAGRIIRGTGGVRKIRIGTKGRGKRGGARVLYYLVVRRDTIYLLLAYDKTKKDDLTAAGKERFRILCRQLQAEKGV
jgi:hypothetical protein